MSLIIRLYFQYSNGTDDDIRLESETVEEMREIVSSELKTRSATYSGIEIIQECDTNKEQP